MELYKRDCTEFRIHTNFALLLSALSNRVGEICRLLRYIENRVDITLILWYNKLSYKCNKMCEKRIKTATFFREIVINLIKCWCTYEGKIYLLQICKRCD